MKIIRTDLMKPGDLKTEIEREWVYNGLDCAVTRELFDVLAPQLDNHTSHTYLFEKELQGPVLEMRCRGVLIDAARKEEVIEEYLTTIDLLSDQLEEIVGQAWSMWDFNWRPNSKDLPELFYDRMLIPPIKKKGKPTCDRGALEKLEGYFVARPLVQHIIMLRDLLKKVSMLRTEIDNDGRMRTSYNIAGTNTGRFSSSFSEFGTGGNFQNIEESLRSVFIADPGMKLANLDGEQIQSRVVGAVEWNLFKDSKYLDACESGDLHTNVAKLCWPKMPWTGNIKKDKDIAGQPFYRHYSYRFMCKKIGHGTNFDGKPAEISRQTKIEKKIIEEFQPKYSIAFPAHTRWKEWTRRQLIEFGYLVNLTGRKRWFFGRRDDDATVREALAYEGQASESGIVNKGMLNVWRHRNCELLMQGHDSILVQYPEEQEDEIIPLIKEQLLYPIELVNGRQFIVPYGCKTGWNFGSWSEKNPDGLKEYEPDDKRKRQPTIPILDRVMYKTKRGTRL